VYLTKITSTIQFENIDSKIKNVVLFFAIVTILELKLILKLGESLTFSKNI
jgi:hypothetical protein